MSQAAHSVLLVAIALTAATGCDKSSSTSGAGAPTSSGAQAASAPVASAPPAPSSEPAGPPPEDLNLAELQKALKCQADAKAGPCRVLAMFSTCKAWNPVVPSGDGRWLGRGFVVEGAKTTEQVTVVRSKRVPSSEVGAGQLPARIGISEIAKAEGTPFDQADRAIKAFERGDIPQRSSPTLEYVNKRTDWPDAFTMRTVGGQVYAITQGGSFFCTGPKQQLLLVHRATTRSGQGDGVYAELWATSW